MLRLRCYQLVLCNRLIIIHWHLFKVLLVTCISNASNRSPSVVWFIFSQVLAVIFHCISPSLWILVTEKHSLNKLVHTVSSQHFDLKRKSIYLGMEYFEPYLPSRTDCSTAEILQANQLFPRTNSQKVQAIVLITARVLVNVTRAFQAIGAHHTQLIPQIA